MGNSESQHHHFEHEQAKARPLKASESVPVLDTVTRSFIFNREMRGRGISTAKHQHNRSFNFGPQQPERRVVMAAMTSRMLMKEKSVRDLNAS